MPAATPPQPRTSTRDPAVFPCDAAISLQRPIAEASQWIQMSRTNLGHVVD